MSDTEILEEVYRKLVDRYHSPEQKMFSAIAFIEEKREEARIGVDVAATERHRGLEIGPDGTVTDVK